MSSTSDADRDKALERLAREFYASRLLPLARPSGSAAAGWFPVAPDATLPTYYTRRAKTRWTRTDFEAQSATDPAGLAPVLEAFWRSAGNPELAALAAAFAALAAEVYDVDTRSGEVTPFMYVMF